VKAGETVFPDLPDSFFDDFTDSGPDPVVTLCKEAALDGTPCAGTLKVNLPAA
jgi:ribose transport system substrate-binding protein